MELCAVQLPGRENRLLDEPFTRSDAMVDALAPQLEAYGDIPFAIFGHCMGALLAFELTRRLRDVGARAPGWLLVSAFRAPHLPDGDQHIHDLPEAEFTARLREKEAVPEAILQDDDAMSVFSPVLRADFAVCETYRYRTADPLRVPISVFGGLSDPTVGHGALHEWRVQTVSAFSCRMLPGGHLFLNSAHADVLRFVTEDLERALGGVDAAAPLARNVAD